MTEKQTLLIKAAIAALEQPKTHQADVDYAKKCLDEDEIPF